MIVTPVNRIGRKRLSVVQLLKELLSLADRARHAVRSEDVSADDYMKVTICASIKRSSSRCNEARLVKAVPSM